MNHGLTYSVLTFMHEVPKRSIYLLGREAIDDFLSLNNIGQPLGYLPIINFHDYDAFI